MNVYQINKKNMLNAINNYMDEHEDKWNSIARLATTKSTLAQILEDLELAQTAQAEAKATFGKSKLALKKAIALKADVVNDLLEAFALTEEDYELARKMRDSTSSLYRLPYSAFFIRVKTIIEKATELKDVLTNDFGMQAEQLTNLQQDFNRLLEINGKPRAYQIRLSIATNKISQLLSEANDITRQMDKLISIFKDKDPNFYHGYKKARMIVD